MKSIYYILSVFALFVLGSCGGENNQPSPGSADGDGPITHTLDTAVGYCFQLSLNGVMEAVEISIINNKIAGSGNRLYLKTQEVYTLDVQGVLDGNTAEVEIQALNTRDSKKSYTHLEIWEFEEEALKVKKRKIEKLEGDFTFNRVHCQTKGNSDSTRYDTFGEFHEGYAVVSKDGKYGLMNEQGELTIPLSFKDIGIVREGSIVYFDEYVGLRGLLDVNGNILVEPKYVEMIAFDNGLAAFMTDDGKWGFLDKSLNIAIKPKYMNVNFFKPDFTSKPFSEGLANVQNMDQTWNYINSKGETVIGGNFAFAHPFENGEAKVFKDNKWYTINKGGKCIDNCD